MKIIAKIHINSLNNNSYLYHLKRYNNSYVWESYFGKATPCLTLVKPHWEMRVINYGVTKTIFEIPFRDGDLEEATAWTT